MRRVSPSVLAREKLHRLLSGGADREANIVSVFVAAVTRMVVQELIEGELGDHLVAAAVISVAAMARWVGATVMSVVGCAPPRVRSTSRCRRSVDRRAVPVDVVELLRGQQ